MGKEGRKEKVFGRKDEGKEERKEIVDGWQDEGNEETKRNRLEGNMRGMRI